MIENDTTSASNGNRTSRSNESYASTVLEDGSVVIYAVRGDGWVQSDVALSRAEVR